MFLQQFLVNTKLEQLVFVSVNADYFDLTIALNDCSEYEICQLIFYQDEHIEQLYEPTGDVYNSLDSFWICSVRTIIEEREEDLNHDCNKQPKVDE